MFPLHIIDNQLDAEIMVESGGKSDDRSVFLGRTNE